MARVLVAEDDWDTQEAIKQALDGQSALDALRASAVPLVVLLDLYLGLISGETVLRSVAADATLAARHRFIVVTAVPPASPDIPYDLLTALDIPLISKPFDLTTLLDAIHHAAQRLPHD